MAILSEMGILGVGTFCIFVLAAVRTKEGKPFIRVPELISRGVNWEIIILIASTMPLCNALEAEEVGVLQTVIAWLSQVFAGLDPTMFLVVFTLLFIVTTQFTHNLVLMLVFTPVLTKMGVALGANPVLVMLLVFYTAMTAYATPAASANAALIFGNTEWVTTKRCIYLRYLSSYSSCHRTARCRCSIR